MDNPRPAMFRGVLIRTAHVMSTLHGDAGTTELITFCERIGMRKEWIQHKGTHREHFDLMESVCDRAVRAGATVDRRLLGQTMTAKREAYESKSG